MSTSRENPVIILVVVLALVIYALWSIRNEPAPDIVVDQAVNSAANTNSENVNSNSNIPMEAIGYSDALVKYKNSRIQFDTACQANPNNVTYKNNTYIMIDNRAPVARAIKVGSLYTVKGYGFRIVKISSFLWPVKWLVDCDQSKNVATIFIQE